MRFKPHKYQQDAIRFGLDHKKCGLFLPMGAGKTVTTLTILDQLIPMEVNKVLIIGPVRVIRSTWPEEIEKWDHVKDLRYSIISGTPKQRQKAMDADAEIYLIGKENVQWLIESQDFEFDMVVIDELSTFKNPKAKRFKALRSVMPSVDRFIGLTGTPAPKGVPDLWSQIYLMDGGKRLGRTLTQFRTTYLKPGRRNGMIIYDWKPQDGAIERIEERISDICMSLDQKDCVELPPLNSLKKAVQMPLRIMKDYHAFKRERVQRLENDEALLAANAGVLCGQLLQYASGEIYTRDLNTGETTGSTVLHSAKLDALEDLVESANGSPVLVFYYYKHELERLKKHLSKAYEVRTLDGLDDIHDWNRGKIDVLLVHPASAGHGLNLQDGGHIAIWYTLPNWNLELYQQANARIYRQGQKEKVTIYHIIAKGTVDEDQLEALEKKDVTQKALIEALRR